MRTWLLGGLPRNLLLSYFFKLDNKSIKILDAESFFRFYVFMWYGFAVTESAPHHLIQTMHHLIGNFTTVLLEPARIWS